jgi:hypothetical protein
VVLSKTHSCVKLAIPASPARNRLINIRSLFTLTVVTFGNVTASALAEDKPALDALSEVTLDIDRDGKMDRAVLVGDPESGLDLYIYLAAGDERLDLSRMPNFLKKEITDGSIIDRGLASKGKGTLTVESCYGCGANKSWNETLTIVHRGGEFLVAGYTRDWDWNSHIRKADGEWDVETLMGGCDINFLTGKGVASEGLDEGKPLKGKFKPVKLADWSAEKRPKACEF